MTKREQSISAICFIILWIPIIIIINQHRQLKDERMQGTRLYNMLTPAQQEELHDLWEAEHYYDGER